MTDFDQLTKDFESLCTSEESARQMLSILDALSINKFRYRDVVAKEIKKRIDLADLSARLSRLEETDTDRRDADCDSSRRMVECESKIALLRKDMDCHVSLNRSMIDALGVRLSKLEDNLDSWKVKTAIEENVFGNKTRKIAIEALTRLMKLEKALGNDQLPCTDAKARATAKKNSQEISVQLPCTSAISRGDALWHYHITYKRPSVDQGGRYHCAAVNAAQALIMLLENATDMKNVEISMDHSSHA